MMIHSKANREGKTLKEGLQIFIHKYYVSGNIKNFTQIDILISVQYVNSIC